MSNVINNIEDKGKQERRAGRDHAFCSFVSEMKSPVAVDSAKGNKGLTGNGAFLERA